MINHPKKIAIVVQRCAQDIAAGAEVYAWQLGQALSNEGTFVDIYTSQSDDYIKWNNKLPKREQVSSSFNILRFPVVHSRFRILFALTKRVIFFLQKINPIYTFLSKILDYIFLRTQGPWCPSLWQQLKQNEKKYDLIIIKSYLYAPNVYSILNKDSKTKSLFIVTAHNEPEFKLRFVEKCLSQTNIVAFVSLAEKNLCNRIWKITKTKSTLVLPPGLKNKTAKPHELSDSFAEILKRPYFLCLGRIDKNKNVDFIFRNTPAHCRVLFAGEKHADIPSGDQFVYLGKVSDYEKQLLLQHALALLVVSRFESYSMVTAEGIQAQCPILALQGCEPIDELLTSYGGILSTEADFNHNMDLIWNHQIDLNLFKLNNKKIENEKSWQRNAQKILSLL